MNAHRSGGKYGEGDDERLAELAAGARSDTVTPARLTGSKQFFSSVIDHLEPGEQPHYAFPMTRGLFAEPSLILESDEGTSELHDGGTVVVTDRSVRIVTPESEWTIPYSILTRVEFLSHPGLRIHTDDRRYEVNVADAFFEEKETIAEAILYIRQRRRAV